VTEPAAAGIQEHGQTDANPLGLRSDVMPAYPLLAVVAVLVYFALVRILRDSAA